MAKIRSLTVGGETYDIKDGGAVRFDEVQLLTDDQKNQARANIGAGTLVVTAQDGMASHNTNYIRNHVQNGGTAVFASGESYYSLSYIESNFALFSFVEDDGYVYGVKVFTNGSVETVEFFIGDSISIDVPTDAHINSLIDAKLGVIENGTY